MKHNYYNQCEYCGALLDPGEVCECKSQDDDLDVGAYDLTDIDGSVKAMPTDMFFDLLTESFSVG